MGFSGKRVCCWKLRNLAISLLLLAISSSSHMGYVQGRILQQDKRAMILRSQIGSRPPRCDRRCFSCSHCEAIQVPTNPQIKNNFPQAVPIVIAYARGDDTSNYKPMSWKCKCGDLIFNP